MPFFSARGHYFWPVITVPLNMAKYTASVDLYLTSLTSRHKVKPEKQLVTNRGQPWRVPLYRQSLYPCRRILKEAVCHFFILNIYTLFIFLFKHFLCLYPACPESFKLTITRGIIQETGFHF